jgi:hypothetical protein
MNLRDSAGVKSSKADKVEEVEGPPIQSPVSLIFVKVVSFRALEMACRRAQLGRKGE